MGILKIFVLIIVSYNFLFIGQPKQEHLIKNPGSISGFLQSYRRACVYWDKSTAGFVTSQRAKGGFTLHTGIFIACKLMLHTYIKYYIIDSNLVKGGEKYETLRSPEG